MKHLIYIILLVAATLIFSIVQFFFTGIYGFVVFYPLTGLMILTYVLTFTLRGVK